MYIVLSGVEFLSSQLHRLHLGDLIHLVYL